MLQVLLFDSGVGGWSVAQKLLRDYPTIALTYLADNAGFPYGSRNPQELADRLETYLRQLIRDFSPDLIVCACNTVSTTVLNQLQQKLGQPILGVLPALSRAVMLSRKQVVGLLATPGTVASAFVEDEVRRHGGVQVRPLGCARLATLAEKKMAGQRVNLDELQECIAPLLQAADGLPAPDIVVLGCSHFPLLMTELQQVAGSGVEWLDPADELLETATRMRFSTRKFFAAGMAPRHRVVLTGPQRAAELQRTFQNLGFSDLETLDAVGLPTVPPDFLSSDCRAAAAG